MKLILDGSPIYNTRQAGYKYFMSLLPYLAKDPAWEIVLTPSPTGLFNQLGGSSNVKVKSRKKFSLSRVPLGPLRSWLSSVRKSYQEHALAKEAEGEEIAIFHSFLYDLPPSNHFLYVPSALDTIPERLGKDFLKQTSEKLLEGKARAFDRADHIVAISEQTKKDVCEFYGVNPERITAVPLGVDLRYFSSPSTEAVEISEPFFLQVGGRLNHKNFARLAEAFSLSGLEKTHLLVCVGEPWSEAETTFLKKLGIEERVQLFPHASEEKLKALYYQAEALVYPSLYEGFGLPVVEAMACGTPVLASRIGVVEEVGANAVAYFNPLDINSIASGLKSVITSTTQTSLREGGPKRAKEFSWEKTAEGHLKIFHQVAKAKTRAPKVILKRNPNLRG